MKKIVVTGSAGFIGSEIAEFLLKKGFFIVGVDNFSNKYSKKIYLNNLNILKKYKNFVFYRTNILNQKKIYSLIKNCQPDFLIHCAAKVGIRESINDPLLYNKTNVLGTQTILEAIRFFSPKTKTILLSSSSVYGDQKKLPFSENMIPQPLSPYGLSKYLMEQLAKQYFYLYEIPIVVIRAFSVYGPRGRSNMLPFLLIKSFLKEKPINIFGSNKDNQRDWTYIDDLVSVINNLINDYSFDNFEIINVGRGQTIGIDDFVDYFIIQLTKYGKSNLKIKKIQRQQIETSITLANIKKAKKILNFSPKMSYKEGVNKTIKYFLENISLCSND